MKNTLLTDKKLTEAFGASVFFIFGVLPIN